MPAVDPVTSATFPVSVKSMSCPARPLTSARALISNALGVHAAPQNFDIVPFVLKSDCLHSENLKIRVRDLEATSVFSVWNKSTSRANIKVPSNIVVNAAI